MKGKPLWGQPFGAHRISWDQPSGAHRTSVWPAIVALTVRPAIAALTVFINNKNSLKTSIPF